ncbi:permease-like cell division protein FtsX [Fusibacter ferrireducens]|uniref:Cell division protein FtsX n=1 Tax=Fusibacter ferrireducens TaxID=2785058 RepID=A0ABR9ZYB8_9FIRM|nr:permease-like cell division protein FtsX [Fusibacter ferrireducens]MBF4695361.1 ABC transporter permease [Fusibacter ferrireducens]
MTIKPLFTLREALKSLWRNRLMSIASISSVSATLIILGIIFSLIVNVNASTQAAKDQIDSIKVYLEDGLSSEEGQVLQSEIEALVGVESVVYENKDEALTKWKVSWEENAYMLEGLEKNPLPNAFIIYLSDIYYSESVLASLGNLDGIEQVKSHQDIVTTLLTFSELIRKAGLIIIFILIAISTFIIHNTIKLAVNARNREINIMKYVGATNWFIRWPFLVEGTILGLLGAGISAVVIKMGYSYVYNLLCSDFFVFIAAYVIKPEVLMKDLVFLFVVIGAGIGALGSIWSMRKYLNV